MEENNKKSRGKLFAAVLLIILAIAIIVVTISFVRHRIAYAVTDAVFVRTDTLTAVGFNRVNGRVLTITKKNGDPVTKNEILARIDDTNYRLAVEQLSANLAAKEKELQVKRIFLQRIKKETILDKEIAVLNVEELKKRKDALKAGVEAVQVEVEQLVRDNRRYKNLVTTRAVSHSKAEDIHTRLRAKQLDKKALIEKKDAIGASIATARRRVELAEVKKMHVMETEKEIEVLEEKIKGTRAALNNAENDLKQCILRSPLTGRVAKRFITPGTIVSPQKVAFALIDPENIYIIALLEEQKLAGVEPGAVADITIDAYPDLTYKGRVEKIMPASAATFALAPRDISAGEFTKVSQRIPVRIMITKGDISLLKVGMGGEVEIKRQNRSDAESQNKGLK